MRVQQIQVISMWEQYTDVTDICRFLYKKQLEHPLNDTRVLTHLHRTNDVTMARFQIENWRSTRCDRGFGRASWVTNPLKHDLQTSQCKKELKQHSKETYMSVHISSTFQLQVFSRALCCLRPVGVHQQCKKHTEVIDNLDICKHETRISYR